MFNYAKEIYFDQKTLVIESVVYRSFMKTASITWYHGKLCQAIKNKSFSSNPNEVCERKTTSTRETIW